LLDGRLANPARRGGELEHLAGCADCRAALEAVRRAAEAPHPGEAQGLDPRTREELLQLFRAWRAGRRRD
jgi:hypothetical protein